MIQDLLAEAEQKMSQAVDHVVSEFATVRTGRANPQILKRITVDYYGTPTPLNQVAKLSVPEPTMIVAQPFDPSTLSAIEKAIRTSDLGLNPANDGKIVRIPIPALTEERRKQMVKKVRAMGEDAKTAIRQIRREANEEIKRQEKSSAISEDDARRFLEEAQKITDRHTQKIDDLCRRKETELLEMA